MNGRLLGTLTILGALVLPVSGVSGMGPNQEIQDLSVPETTSSSKSSSFNGPEARVAAMVREALRTPEDLEAWRCLDLALTEMNAPVGNGQDLSSRAHRATDSLTCPNGSVYWTASSSAFPPTQPGGPDGKSWSSDSRNGAWQRVLPSLNKRWLSLVEAPWMISIVLLLSSGALIWFGRSTVLELLASKSGPVAQSDPEPARRGPENPVAMALALWEGGLPSPEIARRTGLAQDALSVLLNMQGESTPVPVQGPARPRVADPYSQTRIERR